MTSFIQRKKNNQSFNGNAIEVVIAHATETPTITEVPSKTASRFP